MQDRVLSMLGLAAHAGALDSGGFAVEKSVKSLKAELVIISADAKKNTVKQFTNMCAFYEVPLRFYGTKESLGHAIGRGERSSVAVNNKGFAKSLLKLLDNAPGGEASPAKAEEAGKRGRNGEDKDQ